MLNIKVQRLKCYRSKNRKAKKQKHARLAPQYIKCIKNQNFIHTLYKHIV